MNHDPSNPTPESMPPQSRYVRPKTGEQLLHKAQGLTTIQKLKDALWKVRLRSYNQKGCWCYGIAEDAQWHKPDFEHDHRCRAAREAML